MFAWILGIGTLGLVVLGVLYFVPAIIATVRGNANALAIILVNLFFGWTVLAWIGALVWSIAGVKSSGAAPASGGAATKTCPFCSESIRVSAVKCGYCGSDLSSNEAQDETARLLAKDRNKWRSIPSDQPL